jgi:esterase/lipase
MTPFFFGESNHQLYGVLHPVNNKVKKNASVLLCNAFGQEYMRSHRAYRQLAMMLTKQGYDVLRFDYRGTGDSALNLNQVNAKTWVEDVNVAIDELKDISAVSNIHIVGLRLGGLIAASASAGRNDIASINLWDPVTSGDKYIGELRNELTDEHTPEDNGELNSNYQDDLGVINFNGFALNQKMQKTLKELNIKNMDLSKIKIIRNIISHKSNDSDGFVQVMGHRNNFQSDLIEAPHDWNYVDKYGGILLPQPIIQGIVNCLL